MAGAVSELMQATAGGFSAKPHIISMVNNGDALRPPWRILLLSPTSVPRSCMYVVVAVPLRKSIPALHTYNV